jgi:hypothetical protein
VYTPEDIRMDYGLWGPVGVCRARREVAENVYNALYSADCTERGRTRDDDGVEVG